MKRFFILAASVLLLSGHFAGALAEEREKALPVKPGTPPIARPPAAPPKPPSRPPTPPAVRPPTPPTKAPRPPATRPSTPPAKAPSRPPTPPAVRPPTAPAKPPTRPPAQPVVRPPKPSPAPTQPPIQPPQRPIRPPEFPGIRPPERPPHHPVRPPEFPGIRPPERPPHRPVRPPVPPGHGTPPHHGTDSGFGHHHHPHHSGKPQPLSPEQHRFVHRRLREEREHLLRRRDELRQWDHDAQARFRRVYGRADRATRDAVLVRINQALELNAYYAASDFRVADFGGDARFGYVIPNQRTIFLAPQFFSAPPYWANYSPAALAPELAFFQVMDLPEAAVESIESTSGLGPADEGPAPTSETFSDAFDAYLRGTTPYPFGGPSK